MRLFFKIIVCVGAIDQAWFKRRFQADGSFRARLDDSPTMSQSFNYVITAYTSERAQGYKGKRVVMQWNKTLNILEDVWLIFLKSFEIYWTQVDI